MQMGENLIIQSLILIGGTNIAKFDPDWRLCSHVGKIDWNLLAMWALLIGDTCMARLSMECEMQGNAVARLSVGVRQNYSCMHCKC